MPRWLRWTSGLSLAGLFVLRTIQSFPFPARAWVSFACLLAMSLAVTATLLLLLRPEVRTIRARPELLVPLGLLWLVLQLFQWTVSPLEFLTTDLLALHLGALAVRITGLLLLTILAATAYLAWETRLVWRVARDEPFESDGGLGDALHHFPAALVAGAFGTISILLLLVPILSVVIASGGFAFLLLVPVGLAFNLLTAPLVPVVMEDGGGIGARMKAGLAAGVSGWRRWWLPVTIQFVLLGGLYFVAYDYTATVEISGGSHFSRSSMSRSGWSAGSVVKWTGGYEDGTAWDDKVAEAWMSTVPPVTGYLLTLFFAVLAIAVKLRIVSRLET